MMKKISLALMVVVSLGHVPITPELSAAKDKVSSPSHKIVVYYFHGKARCTSCKKIEAFTEGAVTSFFAKNVKEKSLEYRVVDVDEKENEHFVQDYQLYTKSVVVVDVANSKQVRWKNLPKVWELLSNEDAFKNYIRDEILAYQKAG